MDLAPYIDHTCLKPDTHQQDIEQLVEEGMRHGFPVVCVPPFWVGMAAKAAMGSDLRICTVAAFPLGYETPFAIMASISESMKLGATEIDQVMNLSAFKSGNYQIVEEELKNSAQIIHSQGGILKVIIETAYLNEAEIKTACEICGEAGADFAKTSTGFAPQGADLEKVKIMKTCLKGEVQIKASGGIKTKEEAAAFVQAGADRIGTSSGVKIIGEK